MSKKTPPMWTRVHDKTKRAIAKKEYEARKLDQKTFELSRRGDVLHGCHAKQAGCLSKSQYNKENAAKYRNQTVTWTGPISAQPGLVVNVAVDK